MKLLDRGDIYFFYEPTRKATRRRLQRVEGPQDVERLLIVLSGDREFGRHCRLLELQGPSFPVASPGMPSPKVTARVTAVSHRPEDIDKALAARTARETTSRRWPGPVQRPAGEGRYALVDHDGHSDLDYVLELPATPGPVQRELGVLPQATYQVRMQVHGETRPVAEPAAIDAAGTELTMELESAEVPREVHEQMMVQRESPDTAEVFAELKLRRSIYPLDPLYTGQWK